MSQTISNVSPMREINEREENEGAVSEWTWEESNEKTRLQTSALTAVVYTKPVSNLVADVTLKSLK